MDKTKKELYDQKNALDLKAVIALNRTTNQVNRRANTIFRKHGLTSMQFAVLEVLYHKGDLKVGQITQKILSTSGNMTVVISNLAQEGMIRKCTDSSDSRASIISITEKGCNKMEEVFPEYLVDLEMGMTGLTDTEKQSLIALLYKMSKQE